MRRLIQVLLLGIVLAGILSTPARAQPELRATLTDFAPWLGKDGTLRITLAVTNRGDEPATDPRVTIAIYEGVETRSQLELTFRGRLGQPVGSDTIVAGEDIPPRTTRSVTVEKPLSEISFFRSNPEDRAYPLRITVRSGRFSSDPIDTHMIYFANPAAQPLMLGLVVPLHSPAVYSSDLRMTTRVDSFARDIRTGRIATIIGAIESHPTVPVTLAPTGLFLDTLTDMSSGFTVAGSRGPPRQVDRTDEDAIAAATTLERLKAILAGSSARAIAAPYSAANLTVLNQRLSPARVSPQISATVARIETGLGVQPLDGWVLPLPGVIDESTMSLLQSAGTPHAILNADSVRLPRAPLTPSSAAEVTTRGGTSSVLIADNGLSARLADTPAPLSPVLRRQRFLAETVTVYLERPALQRGVVATAPIDWEPDPQMVSGILDALAGAPWLQGTTPEVVQNKLTDPIEVETVPTEDAVDQSEIPPSDFFGGLQTARRAIDQFSEISPPRDILSQLEKRLLVAESADWWGTRRDIELGRTFSRDLQRFVTDEFRKVDAPSPLTITLTSQSGVIPLSIISRASYPVDVVLRLESSKLEFPKASPCAEPPGDCISIRRLQPRAQTIEVQVVAGGTGTVPLNISIESPTTGVELSSSTLHIRSTAYNVVGLVLTIGAGIFLFSWPVIGIIRRRNAR